MELIFGEGTDGDCQALIFEPLAKGGYCVTVEWNDITSPIAGGEITGNVIDVSNTPPEGELTISEGDPVFHTQAIPIHHITRLEIH